MNHKQRTLLAALSLLMLPCAVPASDQPVCPKSSPPAKTMWAVRIQDLGKDSEQRLPLSCLQGLVNRKQPRIFLAYDRFDEMWLDWLRERGDVNEVRWVTPKEIYAEFLSVAKGLVVTDPDLSASVNVATMLAAVEGWLPVTPALLQQFSSLSRNDAVAAAPHPGPLPADAGRGRSSAHGERANHQVRTSARVTDSPLPSLARGEGQGEGSRPRVATEPLRLKVAMDLRGKWQKDVEAYRWFYATYGERMSRRACAHVDPDQTELRDYLVEFAVPLFWVSHPTDAERSKTVSWAEEEQFARELLRKLPTNIPCFGWWDKGKPGRDGCGENGPYSGMDLISPYAKFEVCTAFDGYARGVSNLSVHSGTSATFRQRTVAPPRLETGKVYYTFTRTDGDGPNFWRQVYRDLWNQPDHGKVPVGWQTGPCTHDLIPDIIDYFYRRATPNDVFVNALTGIGYIREVDYAVMLPTAEQGAVWDRYMELSRRYFRLMDLSLLTTFEAFKQMPPETMARFTKLPGIKAIYGNYHRFETTTADNATSEINGVPIFRAVVRSGGPLDTPEKLQRTAASVAQQIREFTPAKRPAFLHISLSNWLVDMRALVEIEKALGPDYVAVRADQLPTLYKQARKRR